jgi:hypothetical protein
MVTYNAGKIQPAGIHVDHHDQVHCATDFTVADHSRFQGIMPADAFLTV